MNTNPSTRKRTHLKPDQVVILQESFNSNALPDSTVRSQLARDLGVTERTIQIWFQNRRAKARKTECPQSNGDTSSNLKSSWMDSNTRHSTPPRYQATFRTMMTPERFEELKHDGQQQVRKRPRSSSKPERKSLQLINSMHRAVSEGTNHVFPTDIAPIQMVHFPVHVLRIGSWTRFAHASPNTNQTDWDLVCHGSPLDREFIWKVQAEGHHFRVQVGFDSIDQIRLCQQVQLETGDIVGQLEIELSLPVAFSMWRFGKDNQWIRCGDFTEDKQASVDRVHVLQGNHDAFKQALLDLISLAPELAAKISVMPIIQTVGVPPPALDICRDFTISPSATPEPSSFFAAAHPPFMMHHPPPPQQHFSKTHMSHLMLQAPFFYPPALPSNGGNEELYRMIQQQQQQQQHQQQHQQQMMYAPSLLM
ncbi:hypothetical protein EDC94DRAFT_439913 [Helicostylum pulchrum]|nr:hypothetical protein EDC94DRAFT_439913 [Helicostylum pulchrum]